VKMISEEGPDAKIKKLYLLSETEEPITPCGICRQSIFELLEQADEDIELVSYSKNFEKEKTFSFQMLFPEGFRL